MLKKLKKLFFDKENIILFKFSPPFNVSVIKEKEIVYFESLDSIPKKIYHQLFPRVSLMKFRLWQKKAIVVCVIKDDVLIAYGWVQSWSYFKAFRKIEPHATMLGPYWTHPNFRGQGFYGKLIDSTLTLCNKNYPVVIYANQQNDSSLKGIRKKNFQEIGPITINIFIKFFKQVKISKN